MDDPSLFTDASTSHVFQITHELINQNFRVSICLMEKVSFYNILEHDFIITPKILQFPNIIKRAFNVVSFLCYNVLKRSLFQLVFQQNTFIAIGRYDL